MLILTALLFPVHAAESRSEYDASAEPAPAKPATAEPAPATAPATQPGTEGATAPPTEPAETAPTPSEPPAAQPTVTVQPVVAPTVTVEPVQTAAPTVTVETIQAPVVPPIAPPTPVEATPLKSVLTDAQKAAAAAPETTPDVDIGDAEAAPELSNKQLRWFKPSPGNLPANPRAQVDFTAYTLEFGEVKLGLANIIVGVLPHVHVGTSVPLDILGIPNVHAKVHATEGGPFDVGAIVNYHVLERSAFEASFFSAGGIVSVTPVTPWSLHVGGKWTRGNVAGSITLDNFSTLLWFLDEAPQGDELAATELLQIETIDAKFSTDIRFNRRDSIVLQAEAMLWANVQKDDELFIPEFLGLEKALAYDGMVPITEAAVASIAWQFAWEHLEIRLGVGVSSIPASWLLQSTEVSYRFGGKSRTKEKRMREGWFRNKKDLGDGLDETPGTPGTPGAPTTPAPKSP